MSSDVLVGGDVLRLVTAGLYGNPLELYREYIQNAADSVSTLGEEGGEVVVEVDPLGVRIALTDNGTGLSPADAAGRLIPLGNSTKDPAVDRGLRGVGRLSGLAFAEHVHFTTRTRAEEPVTRVSWSGRALRNPDLKGEEAAVVIEACTTVQTLSENSWPNRFFQVSIDGVARHAVSTLLNQDAVRNYVGEVCPVPMAKSFPFAADITDFLSAHADYFTLDVRFEGVDGSVKRPFGAAIALTDNYSAPFERLEKRLIPQVDGDAPAALLWLAHTPYAGSIPRRLGVRGLRARVGNIQVGSDGVFNHLFLEARFSGWCVGEVHIVDSRIVPNARRDYFEPGPHLRNLENHIGAIAQEISARCRAASSHRNKLRSLGAILNQVKSARTLTTSGYLSTADADAVLARIRERTPQILRTLDELKMSPTHFGHEDELFYEGWVKSEGPGESSVLESLPKDAHAALQKAFGAVSNAMPPDSALNMIESIVRRVSEAKQEDPDAES